MNYKPLPKTISAGSFAESFNVEPARIKVLQGANPTTTGETLHFVKNNTDYQVPSGKTFLFKSVRILLGGVSRLLSIYKSTAVDGVVGEADRLVIQTPINTVVAQGFMDYSMPHNANAPEDTYINWKVDNITSSPAIDYLIGYEE